MTTIAAFGVRADEKPYFDLYKDRDNLKLTVTEKALTEETMGLAAGADGVSVTGICRMNADRMKELAESGVRFISTRTIGYNHLDLEAAAKYGIRCSNVTYSPYGVANYTVMLMLAILRKFMHIMFRSMVMDYSLHDMQGREMQNMTVGIIGMGRIGRAVAQNLQGFGCRVIAYTPHPKEETRKLAEPVSLEELYHTADIITLHTPATPDNFHMINKDTIAKMKDGVILINTARGELIDTEDLIDAVESGKIGGVAIDSFEHEQDIIHVDHEYNIIHNRQMLVLKAYPNVIVSPHAAFYTDQASADMVRCSVEGLVDWSEGRDNPYEIHAVRR